jgi:hypothetical protein
MASLASPSQERLERRLPSTNVFALHFIVHLPPVFAMRTTAFRLQSLFPTGEENIIR